MSFIKKLYVVLLVLFTQSYAFASYYTPDVNKDCTLSSYSKINEFISKCGVNERIANEEVFLDKKFTGKYPTLLYIAVLFNDLKMVKKLVTLGADVNALNYFPESSALMKAVENNNIEMVKYLLDKGADVNQTTPKYYLSAIDFAATYEMALLLLSHNAKVDKINGYTYYTPLQKAILLENNQMIQAYIPKSNIYQKDYLFEKDALYYAVAARNMEAVKMLINAGAKISPAEYQVYKDMVSNEDIIKTLSNIVDKNKKEVKLRENVSAAILYDKIKSADYKLLNIFTDILEDEEYYALTDPSANNMTINEYEPYRDTVKSLNYPLYEEATGFDLRAYHEAEDQKEYDEDFEPYLRYFPMTAAVTYDDVELFKAMLDANHLKMQYPVKYHTNLFAIAVFNHNIETVRAVFKTARPQADYERSLAVLKYIKNNSNILTKSGLMIGLGETFEQITETFNDLINAGCDILTIGQYIQPSKAHLSVEKYYKPEEYEILKDMAKAAGFKHYQIGPLVRSSYRAAEIM